MRFWIELYKDERKENEMRILKDYMDHNYRIAETEGP